MDRFAASLCQQVAQLFLVAGFIAVLANTSATTWINLFERRSTMPQLDSSRLKRFPPEFESYFDRNFAWRDQYVRRFAQAKIDLLGVSPSPRVLFGEDGWLFLNHEAEASYLPANSPELNNRLREWERALPEWRSWLAERGIRLLVVFAPDKQSVYPEHLPAFARKSRFAASPLDNLINKLHDADPQLDILDTGAVFQPVKNTRPLFFKTDTHWNQSGARLAYQATARRLGIPRADADFRVTGTQIRDGDLGLRLLGYWPGPDETFDDLQLVAPAARPVSWRCTDDCSRLDYLKARAWEQPNATLGKCVLFHDSFGDEYYSKLLAEHFTSFLAVPSNHMDPKLIERERPNVVILEIVERLIQATGARRPTDPPRRSVTK